MTRVSSRAPTRSSASSTWPTVQSTCATKSAYSAKTGQAVEVIVRGQRHVGGVQRQVEEERLIVCPSRSMNETASSVSGRGPPQTLTKPDAGLAFSCPDCRRSSCCGCRRRDRPGPRLALVPKNSSNPWSMGPVHDIGVEVDARVDLRGTSSMSDRRAKSMPRCHLPTAAVRYPWPWSSVPSVGRSGPINGRS